MPSFLSNAGLDSRQIGNVFILISVSTLIASPSWGTKADKLGSRSKYLVGFPLIAATIMAPLILFPGYYQAILIALVQGALIVPLVPLADSVCMERCKSLGWKYGRIRLWGTVGFLASSGVGGFIAEFVGWEPVMLLMLVIICLIAIGGFKLKASSMTPSETEGPLRNECILPRHPLILRPLVLFFLGSTILYQTAFGTYNLFFGINLEQTTHTTKWISIAWTIATMSEILFFGVVDSFIRKYGPLMVMGAAMACAALRWGVLSYTHSLSVILSLQALHGIMMGGFVTGAVTFSSRLFPSTLKTFAQGLHNAAYNGLGGAMAALTCSYAFFEGGTHTAFLFSTIAAVAAMMCLAIVVLLYREQELTITREAPDVT